MKLIYIGDHFYICSGTRMSSIYFENGNRADFGFIKSALRMGESVTIRQASSEERKHYQRLLNEILHESNYSQLPE